MSRITLFVYALVVALLVVYVVLVPSAEASGPPPEVGGERYGYLFEHRHLSHHVRPSPGDDGARYRLDYGIAYERLPDQPEDYESGRGGRMLLSVLWPEHYDPARRAMWDEVARCESTWRWDINTGNGYHGGLQFHPTTWRAYGGGEYASHAHLAYPEQQIAVAERVLRHGHGPHGPQGRGAWPHCGRNLR